MVRLPEEKTSFMKLVVGVFLSFWLCGWAVGFVSALAQVMEGKGTAFLTTWLAGWTVGGCVVVFILVRLFRKGVPESFVFRGGEVGYDTGLPSLPVRFGRWDARDYSRIFSRRKQMSFSAEELKTVRLSTELGYQRLVIDRGVDRIEVGQTLTEPEREWLHALLLSSIQG